MVGGVNRDFFDLKIIFKIFMKNRTIVSAVIWLPSVVMAYAQPINKPKLDSLFTLLAEKNKAMGSEIPS